MTWLVNDSLCTLLEQCREVDDIILFKRHEWNQLRHAGDLWRFLRDLHRRQFDLVIDLQGLFRSGLCTFFAKAPRKVGFADAREFASVFYHEAVRVPAQRRHAVERNLHVASAALEIELDYQPATFRESESVANEADRLLRELALRDDQLLLAVAPASRWVSKTWPESFFVESIDRIVQQSDRRVVCWLLGSSEERQVGERIVAEAGPNVANLMGRTSLPTMLALLRRSAMLLTNDSGPMHVAAAMEIPTVALFGPTDATRTGPYGAGHHVFRSNVECSPCFHRVCPLPRQLCRDDVISPERVSGHIVEYLIKPEIPS